MKFADIASGCCPEHGQEASRLEAAGPGRVRQACAGGRVPGCSAPRPPGKGDLCSARVTVWL